MNPNPSGAFLDFWVHFHSINVVVACLGIGLTVQSDQMIWAVAGIAGGNVLSNFNKLTLARTMLRELGGGRSSARSTMLADYSTDTEVPVLSPQTNRRKQLFQIARELFAYPGPVVILTLTLTADAALTWGGGVVNAPLSKAYLAVFALTGIGLKIARTRAIVRDLESLGCAESKIAVSRG